ncbi:MAG TPA: hypothetical protein VLG91_00680, partial [Streptomyces sp.]|nr:hypothetical protein [Streptomyces sp.]
MSDQCRLLLRRSRRVGLTRLRVLGLLRWVRVAGSRLAGVTVGLRGRGLAGARLTRVGLAGVRLALLRR